MITCSAWRGKRYAVLGLARSGAATVASLVASGAEVVAWDADASARDALGRLFLGEGGGPGAHVVGRADGVLPIRSTAELGPGLRRGTLNFAELGGLDLTTVDALVLSPGVPLNTHPLAVKARAAGVPIIGDIELFAQARSGLPPHKVVGITGTNGKSTTTALVHHILAGAGVPSLMGGNIGLPILAQEPLPEGGVYVLELSSYQIDLTQTLDCDVAVLLNITPDHLDRYDGFEAYAASKRRLFAMSNGQHFEGRDERLSMQDAFDIWSPWKQDGRTYRDATPLGTQHDWPSLQGPHNAENALAAINSCLALGVDETSISEALRTFTGLPHRTERIGEVNRVGYVNDSKATNPDSAAPALAAFARVHWILGGRAKGADLDACRPHLSHVTRAYTIGEAGPVFAAVLRRESVPVEEAGTLARAVARAAAQAQPGETVLLSPAAASFDQFTDYEARGDVFRALVEALR